MLSAWHNLGMKSLKERSLNNSTAGTRGVQPAGVSWLAQQRARSVGKSLVSSIFGFVFWN